MPKRPVSQKDIDRLRSWFGRLGSSDQDESRKCLGLILKFLREHKRKWVELVGLIGVATTLSSRFDIVDLARLAQLHEALGDCGTDDAKRVTIVERVSEILERYRLAWIDVPDLLASSAAAVSGVAPDPSSTMAGPTPVDKEPSPLDLLMVIVPDILDITEDEAIVLSLWAIGTYIYRQYYHFPRLAFLSPVRGCGKTSGLKVLETLVANPHRTDHVTPAALFHMTNSRPTSLLLDEGDNLGLGRDGILRSMLNSGHERGGKFDRAGCTYSTYAPVAIAAIGTLPLPLLDRSWTINMFRTKRDMPLKMHQHETIEQLEFVRNNILDWVQGRTFDPDPPLPWKAASRRADNSRAFAAIADADRPEWGRIVREALVRLSKRFRDEDLLIILLRDIRGVFDTLGVDRIRSVELVARLLAMDDAPWIEFEGVRGDQQPRKLTPSSMAAMLRIQPPLGPIRSRTIWFPSDRVRDSGYHRSQFEPAWARLLDDPDTRTQPGIIKGLLSA